MDRFEKIVTDRVVSELNERKIKQVQLISLCKDIDMEISQSDVSKIYSGKKTLNLYQFASICKALKKPMESFAWTDEDKPREDFCNPHNSGVLHDSGSEMEYYVGKYYFYYLSTASGENKILKGRLFIEKEREFYVLNLNLDTGEQNRHGERIIKKYVGRILLSSSLNAAYLILKSESIGEICMICFRHRKYSVKDMECRIGLALTMSAGEEKVPAVHRCLLFRERVSEEKLEELRPWMNLIYDRITIEKDVLEEVLEKEKKEKPQYERQLDNIKDASISREIVELSVENIRRQLPMERKELMGFLSLLYKKSDVVKNYKVTQSDDIRFYEKMEALKEDAAVPQEKEGREKAALFAPSG